MKIPPVKVHFPDVDRERIHEQIEELLETGMLTLGKYGRQFEQEFAA